jgi:hypothetical protein
LPWNDIHVASADPSIGCHAVLHRFDAARGVAQVEAHQRDALADVQQKHRRRELRATARMCVEISRVRWH